MWYNISIAIFITFYIKINKMLLIIHIKENQLCLFIKLSIYIYIYIYIKIYIYICICKYIPILYIHTGMPRERRGWGGAKRNWPTFDRIDQLLTNSVGQWKRSDQLHFEVNLVKFDQIWSNMTKFGQFWPNLVNSDQNLVNFVQI